VLPLLLVPEEPLDPRAARQSIRRHLIERPIGAGPARARRILRGGVPSGSEGSPNAGQKMTQPLHQIEEAVPNTTTQLSLM
jgi:hypothetical protein